MDQHKFGNGINVVLALLLVVGIAMTVYAVTQVRDLKSEAKGKPVTTISSTCGIKTSARLDVGETREFTLTTCDKPATSIGVWTLADNSFKFGSGQDLAIRITYPSTYVFNPGMVTTQDNKGYVSEYHGNTFYVYDDWATAVGHYVPISGSWKIEVINTGTQSVNFDFSAGFGYLN